MAAPSSSAVEIAQLVRAAALDVIEGRTTESFYALRRDGLLARAVREGLEDEVSAALKRLSMAARRETH